MITVNKYLYEDDFKNNICGCSQEEKFKVIFREVNETELKSNEIEAVSKASIFRMEKLAVMCENCKKIYFIGLSFEGSFKSQFVTIESVELFDGTPIEARNLINRIYGDYEREIMDIATDDYAIKVLSKSEDDEKINVRYVYLNREDKVLYADLQEC